MSTCVDENEKTSMVAELVKLCSIDKSELPKAEKHREVQIVVDTGSEEYDTVFNSLHFAMAEEPEYAEIETTITPDEAAKLISYEYFNPETFWLIHKTGMKIKRVEDFSHLRFTADYIQPAEETTKMKEELDMLCDSIIEYARTNGYTNAPEDMAAFSAVWIGQHCIYRPKGEEMSELDKTAYGALVNDVAICSGFTAAFDLLMLKSGYDAYYFVGQNGDAYHAWSGYTGTNSDVYRCDITKLAAYKGNELACWDESMNFTGNNGDYEEIGGYHYESSVISEDIEKVDKRP